MLVDSEVLLALAEQWEKICKGYSAESLLAAFHFVKDQAPVLVDEFYQQMVKEKNAAEFFSDNIITQRLKSTLHQWLIESFSVAINKNYAEAVKKQQIVGHVHARVGIPSWLIICGVREIERKIFELHKNIEVKATTLEMMSYIIEIIGFSTEIMCRSYEIKTEVQQESKHSYRLFSAMQDVAVQKDKQRSSLLDWENELMYKVLSGQKDIFHAPLSKSEFGLWFIHKAAYAFVGAEQVAIIVALIESVDQTIENIKVIQHVDQLQQYIHDIRQKNREIQHLVDQLFQVSDYIGAGNDALTQLLNRRYLDTVLSREIQFSRKNKTPLALLAIDADYFKSINDRYGHHAGDLALQVLADTLTKYSKGSDYAFRVGGEEFLLLLVDTDLNLAKATAETIRQQVAESVISTSQNVKFTFTVSIGIKEYDGHPDYQRFLDAADQALYNAKRNGRNRVCF